MGPIITAAEDNDICQWSLRHSRKKKTPLSNIYVLVAPLPFSFIEIPSFVFAVFQELIRLTDLN